ncbi:MAG: hypothetical protein ABEJ97_00280 [Halobellus sp.]
MRSVFALFVALVVVAAAPIGVAAASGAPAAATGLTGLQDDGLRAQATATDTTTAPNETETSTATAEPTATAEAENDSADPASIAPGAQLAAIVGVQEVEIGSEVEARAFGQRIAAANSNASKAEVVAGSLDESRERLAELRERLAELEAARENGTISEARYRARAAQLSAQINAVERRLEQLNETATGLPEDVREEHGINVSNIERLRTEAQNLSGPEVAAIAREIAGANPGRGMGGPPEDAGAPGRGSDAPGRDAAGAVNRTGQGPGNGQGPPAAGNESAPGAEDGAPGQSANGSGNAVSGGSGNGNQAENANRSDGAGSGADNSEQGGSDGAPGQSGNGPGNGGSDASQRSGLTIPLDFLGLSDIRI